MKLIKFKPFVRGTLLGFADLEMSNGMILRECPFLEANGRRWCSPPAKPMLDANRHAILKVGKVAYMQIIEFADKSKRSRWSDEAVAAIEAGSKTPEVIGRNEQDKGHRTGATDE